MASRLLGRKFTARDADWRRVLADPWEYVSREELLAAEAIAVDRIQRAHRQRGRAAVGWSAGKDSLVVWGLAMQARVPVLGIFCVPTDELQFSDLMNWLTNHKPRQVELIYTEVNLRWLYRHVNLMFYKHQPNPSAVATKWNDVLHWKPQRAYCRTRNLGLLITGRRTIDGNICGPEGYSVGRDFDTLNPIYDWSHEMTLAYLVEHGIDLPPDYSFEGGFGRGVQPWPMTDRELIGRRQPDLLRTYVALVEQAETTFVK